MGLDHAGPQGGLLLAPSRLQCCCKNGLSLNSIHDEIVRKTLLQTSFSFPSSQCPCLKLVQHHPELQGLLGYFFCPQQMRASKTLQQQGGFKTKESLDFRSAPSQHFLHLKG